MAPRLSPFSRTSAVTKPRHREQWINWEYMDGDPKITRMKNEKEFRKEKLQPIDQHCHQPIPSGGSVNGCIKQVAPACLHRSIPRLMACRTSRLEASLFLNVQSFRCLQFSQAASIISDLMPYLNSGFVSSTIPMIQSVVLCGSRVDCSLRASQPTKMTDCSKSPW